MTSLFCHEPVWILDDFSICFQRKYLQSLIPLTACAISAVSMLFMCLQRRKINYDEAEQYRSLASDDDHETVRHYSTEEEYEMDAYPPDTEPDEEGVLVADHTGGPYQISARKRSTIKSRTVIRMIEIMLLMAGVMLNTAALIEGVSLEKGLILPAASSVIVWIYLLLLCIVKPSYALNRFPRLMYQTLFVSMVVWLTSVLILRSHLIHPRSKTLQLFATGNVVLLSIVILVPLMRGAESSSYSLSQKQPLPSPESKASILSMATFSWVNGIIWTGYNTVLQEDDLWDLDPKDKTTNVIPRYKLKTRTSSLIRHLMFHFRADLLRQALWAGTAAFLTFFPTILLRCILEYIEKAESSSENNAWSLVLLLFLSGLSLTITEGQAFWIGRKTCIRIRSILISEIYDKALNRKTAVFEYDGSKKHADARLRISGIRDLVARIRRIRRDKLPTAKGSLRDTEGSLINLMAVDSFKVGEASAYIHYLIASTPIQITTASVLLYQLLGFSALAGIGSMIILLPVNAYISNRFAQMQKRVLSETDCRMHATNELLTNIRIIKLFAWEEPFKDPVTRRRSAELAYLRKKYLFWTILTTLSSGTPSIIALLSFSVHTLIQKRTLTPSVAFPALSLLQILKIPLDQLADTFAMVLEAKVSLNRIEQFLNGPGTGKHGQLSYAADAEGYPVIGFSRASFTWGEVPGKGAAFATSFSLVNLNFQFRTGDLNLVIGPTGSGKTSLLMALLGEMTPLHGKVYLPERDRMLDESRHFSQGIAYCAQQAWLFNGTVKQNIVFSSSWDKTRYNQVLAACCLDKDIELLHSGSETMVGQKGMALSGGQRQRISLARALYSNATHLILDDVLSAVDSNTARTIVERALTGPLSRGRTRVLVTHNVPLLLSHSQYVVAMENGHVSVAGNTEDVISQIQLNNRSIAVEKGRTGLLTEDLEQQSTRSSDEKNTEDQYNPARLPDGGFLNTSANGKRSSRHREDTTKYMLFYLRSMGHWHFWLTIIALFILQQIFSVGSNFWIRHWSMQHDVPEMAHSASYFVTVYGVLVLSFLAFTFLRRGVLLEGSLVASETLHSRLLATVARAKFSFFDATPIGQILNRMSKDVEQLDQEIAPVTGDIMHGVCSILTIIVVITSVVPSFLIPAFFISAAYCLIGPFYVKTSRDLKRLEAVKRSPLFQQLSETVSGVVTIRAYGDEGLFYQRMHDMIDAHSRPYSLLWASNRWLGFRLDIVGALVSFLTGFIVVLYGRIIDAGAAGLVLVYAISFTENVLWLVRQYAKNEQNSNAVERIQEYCNIDQEPESPSDPSTPRGWPIQGSVEFINFSASYDKAHAPTLRNLTFYIKPYQRVAIVGRTGSGKSSLAMALVRALEADSGKILVDGMDISRINLHALRRSIAVVPQDPSLFSGTIRSNIDPLGQCSDEDILTSLRKVHLLDRLSANRTDELRADESNAADVRDLISILSSPVSAENPAFSQGQRQLLCLARALLQGSKILLLDEATASIDYATDALIQRTIRELEGVTIIAITHRLRSINDFDQVITLDKGEVIGVEGPRAVQVV